MNANWTAQYPKQEGSGGVLACDRATCEDQYKAPAEDSYVPTNHVQHIESSIIDIYTVEHKVRQTKKNDIVTVPFVHGIKILGPKGEITRVQGSFDDGAMVGAMCT